MQTDSLFEEQTIQYDTKPIVMIDMSGSTGNSINNKRILDMEKIHISNLLKERKIKDCHVMFWDDKVNITKINKVSEIKKYKIIHNGGTNVATAINNIPSDWYNSSKDIYIVTDGEISDETDFSKCLNKLYEDGKKIYIATVEPNDYNYLSSDVSAGNTIFKVIKDNKKTFMVKQFICYNQHHDKSNEPFINFSNPDIGPEMSVFRDKAFRVDKTAKFIKHIEKIINEISLIDNQKDKEDALLKLSYDLTVSLHFLVKNRPLSTKRALINLFCNLFVEVGSYRTIRKMLLDEVDNMEVGSANTYQGYKNNREKVFETAQIALYDNVKQAISNVPSRNYVSLIMNTTDGEYIIRDIEDNVKYSISMNDKTYNNSAIKFGNHHIPMVPETITLDNNNYDQCIRQWLRANYAKKYHINPASDLAMYYFFADALRVWLSTDVSEEIKNCYRQLVYVCLDRKRFGTDITEYNYLLNNKPAPVSGNPENINYILYKAMVHGKFIENNKILAEEPLEDDNNVVYNIINLESKLDPMAFWYTFIRLFGDKKLIKAQKHFCNIKKIDIKVVPIKSYTRNINYIEYEYKCYVTMVDTNETGGYIIKAHQLSKNVICSPRYVVSEEGYKCMNDIFCPICHSNVTMEKMPNEKEYLEQFKKDNKDISVVEKYYDATLFEQVKIEEKEYSMETIEDHKLIKMSSLPDDYFDPVAYSIMAPYIQEAVSGRRVEIKNQEEFNNNVFNRFPFLKDIDMTGACIAGGFCRSVLLRQRLKDLDFFLYGENHMENFTRIMNQLLTNLKNQNDKYKFLIMYKPLFNVYEIVVVSDPNDFFKDDYKLDNYKQYKYKSLHQFDQLTIIDPETGIVYKKKNKSKYSPKEEIETSQAAIESRDFSNYFEDGDVSGIRMAHRIQFVLTRNAGIENIFENFDMYPCRVAWNGVDTLFTDKSAKAYKYMINIVNEHNYSELFNHRIAKYFTYGFTIVMPRLDLNKIKNQPYLNIEKVSFKILNLKDNYILVEHNSHIKDQLKSIEKLENRHKKETGNSGKALYKSSLFCSLVSLLRYVKINDIAYRFTGQIVLPNNDGIVEFREKTETIHFIEKINSRIPNHDWYKNVGVGYVELEQDNDLDEASDEISEEEIDASEEEIEASEEEIEASEEIDASEEIEASEEEIDASEEEIDASEEEIEASEEEIDASEEEIEASEEEIDASEEDIEASEEEIDASEEEFTLETSDILSDETSNDTE